MIVTIKILYFFTILIPSKKYLVQALFIYLSNTFHIIANKRNRHIIYIYNLPNNIYVICILFWCSKQVLSLNLNKL